MQASRFLDWTFFLFFFNMASHTGQSTYVSWSSSLLYSLLFVTPRDICDIPNPPLHTPKVWNWKNTIFYVCIWSQLSVIWCSSLGFSCCTKPSSTIATSVLATAICWPLCILQMTTVRHNNTLLIFLHSTFTFGQFKPIYCDIIWWNKCHTIFYSKPYRTINMCSYSILQMLSRTILKRVPDNTESSIKSALSPLAEVGLF